jgi:hypothetical protein
MTKDGSNTVENTDSSGKPKRGRGKPFEPGKGVDPRINRHGRPKNFDELRSLTKTILEEWATMKDKPFVFKDAEGNEHIVTRVELALRQELATKEGRMKVIEIAYGKVPTSANIDLTSKGQQIQGKLSDEEVISVLTGLLAVAEDRMAAKKAANDKPEPG